MTSRRWISVILVLCLLTALTYAGLYKEVTPDTEKDNDKGKYRETLILWYADEELTDYLNSAALAYKEKTKVKITPVCVPGLEYLENINQASVRGDQGPDLYITNNGNLEKAYLAGLAEPIQDGGEICNNQNFPKTALDAITYHGEKLAYPLYFETSFLLFNKTYMTDLAKGNIEKAQDEAEGEAAMATLSESSEEETEQSLPDEEAAEGTQEISENTAEEPANLVTAEAIEQEMEVIIPATLDDIMTFADEYDAPETVEAVFKWDVSDIFYNYFFVGNYISVGGDTGDDKSNISVYNKEALECLRVYQNLNQFFSIDTKSVTYDSILDEFLQGKTVFTIATTDAMKKIQDAQAAGTFQYDFGVAALPDVNENLKSRGLSVTSGIVVNGYTGKKEEANQFAQYLVKDQTDNLYDRTGKIAACYGMQYENKETNNIMQEYEKSVSIPKMIDAEDFWVELEIAFTKIWLGDDPSETMIAVADKYGYPIDEKVAEEVKSAEKSEE